MRKLLILTFLISVLVLMSGCSKTIYICADGGAVDDKADCKYNKVAKLKQKDADRAGTNYVTGYVQATGGKARFVSSFLDKGDWVATFIIQPKGEDPYETTVVVDGKTGQVSCTENCAYAGG